MQLRPGKRLPIMVLFTFLTSLALAADGYPVLGRIPEFQLTNQDGQTFGSQQLKGRVWVANFIFTRCGSTCPIQTAKLAKIKDQLKPLLETGAVTLVSISVDPQYDQPAVLKTYASKYGANNGSWQFLTGTRQEIWDLSKNGFRLPVGENPEDKKMPLFHHSGLVLVDEAQQIRGLYDGLSEEGAAKLVQGVLSIAKRTSAPAQGGKIRMLQDSAVKKSPKALEEYLQIHNKQIQKLKAFGNFSFRDRIDQSNISFNHRPVDDAGRNYIPVHYDHGNGMPIADVDGDGLLDIYFVNQVGSNQLWRNKGNGSFEDITAKAGVAVSDTIGVSASFADIDNDGDADLYVTVVRDGNRLFENQGNGTFKDITAKSGLGHKGHSSGAVFFDYDNDGLLDLLLCNVGQYTFEEKVKVAQDELYKTHESGDFEFYRGMSDAFSGHLKPERLEASILFRNKGGMQFENVNAKVGLNDTSWTGDAVLWDLNRDGWMDIYLLNMQGDDHYYENQQGKKFVDKSRELFPKTSWGAMGVKVFDHDNDGDLGIYITDMHSDMSVIVDPENEHKKSNMQWPESFLATSNAIFGNSFFEPDGDGPLAEISDSLGLENFWPWGLSTGDLNADGFQDIFVICSMNFPYRYSTNKVLLNNKGKGFVSAEFKLGVEPRKDQMYAKPWFTLDCAGADREHSLCEGNNQKTVVMGTLGSRSSAIFDLEGDGDLDIVTLEFNAQPMVLVSNLSQKQPNLSFLQVALKGKNSNSTGIGARVTLVTEGGSLVQVMDGKTGYMSQSIAPLYFGLTGQPPLKSIEVVWPGGKKQTLDGPFELNQTLTIAEK